MSGQWEIVGKNKQKANGQLSKKVSKKDRDVFELKETKTVINQTNAELKSLYNALEEKGSKNEKNSTKENEQKKPPKKQPSQEKKKSVAKEKSQVPKSLESAVKLINSKELQNELEIGKARYPTTPIIWLRGLVVYLNSKLSVDYNNHTFSGKSPEYPVCILQSDVRETLKRALKEAGDSVMQAFFDWCLASMANDMTKGGATIMGYKIILQLLAFQIPNLTVGSLSKFSELRNSYQNRPPIGLSVLWAVGNGGIRDINVGFKAWREVMVPLIDNRNYSNYIVNYLKNLLTYKSTAKASLHPECFLFTIDVLYKPNQNIPAVTRQELAVVTALLKARILESEPKRPLVNLFKPLLERLHSPLPETVKEQILSLLTSCLESNPEVYELWKELYIKHLPESALLLKHMNFSWLKEKNISSLGKFRETVNIFQANNKALKNKQKEEGLTECQRICSELQERMTVSRNFPWRFGSFILIIAIGFVVAYDVKQHGSFKACNIGCFLQDIGVLNFLDIAWSKLRTHTSTFYQWAQLNLPLYYKITVEFLKPHLLWSLEIGSFILSQAQVWFDNGRTYVGEKTPQIAEWVDGYAPGLLNQVKHYASYGLGVLKEFGYLAWEIIVQYFFLVVEWIKTYVLVGHLSPENLQKYSLEALNTTQCYASWTYDWVLQKVQTLSKVP